MLIEKLNYYVIRLTTIMPFNHLSIPFDRVNSKKFLSNNPIKFMGVLVIDSLLLDCIWLKVGEKDLRCFINV